MREAACAYRRTHDVAYLPAIVDGLIEYYIEGEAWAKHRRHGDDIRLVEDLAIDSLTVLEIVFFAEEILQVPIENEKLRSFGTVGDIKAFILSKLAPTRPAARRVELQT
jgi:3-hydroxyacyl-[acyl-carrier-protein] dehydratase